MKSSIVVGILLISVAATVLVGADNSLAQIQDQKNTNEAFILASVDMLSATGTLLSYPFQWQLNVSGSDISGVCTQEFITTDQVALIEYYITLATTKLTDIFFKLYQANVAKCGTMIEYTDTDQTICMLQHNQIVTYYNTMKDIVFMPSIEVRTQFANHIRHILPIINHSSWLILYECLYSVVYGISTTC
jgi:hypothetical protein